MTRNLKHEQSSLVNLLHCLKKYDLERAKGKFDEHSEDEPDDVKNEGTFADEKEQEPDIEISGAEKEAAGDRVEKEKEKKEEKKRLR